jgi:DNA-binding response OmpR family regulator
MRKIRILWTDDEIDVLRPHILFLREKGYEIDTCSNGTDAIDLISRNHYDIIFLDEHMPGLSGIETLRRIRLIPSSIPVVMVTKSEEEDIMEAAIGSEIADYLIKPVKPNQILLSVKKLTDQQRLFTEQTTVGYRQEFQAIALQISEAKTFSDWAAIYRKLTYWTLELEKSSDQGLKEIIEMQENDANNGFARFISSNYLKWLQPGCTEKPVLSHSLMEEKVFPRLEKGRSVFFIIIDNMRFDQWRSILPELSKHYRLAEEELWLSILPTATQYSRNAIFSGLMPREIAVNMPELWVNDDEDESKNSFEEELLSRLIDRLGLKIKWSYQKLHTAADSKKLTDKTSSLLSNDLNVLVINSIDMLSHARTEIDIIRDIAADESAYRSITRSWFGHSALYELLVRISPSKPTVIFSTDHGTIRVKNPVKIVGDRNTTANLRYKSGKNLAYPKNDVFEITDPEKALLPKTNLSSKYIFATDRDFFVYQNNFNHFASYYRDTFQHGGISMHEMILPFARLEPL